MSLIIEDPTGDDASIADMRIEVVKRELNQGALAGFDSSVTEYAAKLVVAALDTFDEHALAAEFRRGFELGEINQRMLSAAPSATLPAESPAPRVLGYVVLLKDGMGHWCDDWDGKIHDTEDAGFAALADALKDGFEGVLAAATEVREEESDVD